MNSVLTKSIYIAILLSLTISSSVLAHPGRTDSFGGHYDRQNGVYHYHHGYSEHYHYDMDNDGDVDCPYTFKNKTPNNNSSSKKDDTIESVYLDGSGHIVSKKEYRKKAKEQNEEEIINSFIIVGGCITLSGFVFYAIKKIVKK